MTHRFVSRCTIDFLNSPTLGTDQDIMFHISIRPKEKAIVRNHYQNGYWAMEERYGPCLVRKHETFEIVILAEMQHYKLAVNGHHLGVFRHRMPLHLVQYLHISGEVEIDHILLEQDMRSAQEHMIVSQVAMPYNVVTVMPNQPPIHHHYTPPPPPYFSQSQQPPNSVSFPGEHSKRTLNSLNFSVDHQNWDNKY